jgi:PPM family protein phosphatase
MHDLIRPARDRGEDRLLIERHSIGCVIAVADGAGGLSGGALAAEYTIERIRTSIPTIERASADALADLLVRIDGELMRNKNAGETTAVVVLMDDTAAVGASVGDSEAWLIDETTITRLTNGQVRKPLLGSGHAIPVGFGPIPLAGRLVVGSDGLFKYCTKQQIVAACARSTLAGMATALLQAVQLPSGQLQDDVALIVCGEDSP